MKIYQWNYKHTIITFIIYWALLTANVLIAKKFELSTMTEWWMNTIVFLSLVLLCILTYRTGLNIFYRLLFIPASWVTHAVLTFLSAFVLGILMLDPNHIRTSGEHRAVFILASLPIMIFAMRKSKIFVMELTKNNQLIKAN